MKFVDGSNPCLNKSTFDHVNLAYNSWKETDSLVLFWINASLTAPTLQHVAFKSHMRFGFVFNVFISFNLNCT